jgi:hypothetical protein
MGLNENLAKGWGVPKSAGQPEGSKPTVQEDFFKCLIFVRTIA